MQPHVFQQNDMFLLYEGNILGGGVVYRQFREDELFNEFTPNQIFGARENHVLEIPH